MSNDSSIDFEDKANDAYVRYAPLAKRYYYTFDRPAVSKGGLPTALFIGNHSSGKSSLVNWIVGGESVQDTGVAPTDDGFTILQYGERDEDVAGPAALSRLAPEFRCLESFGPSFTNRLRLKVRARESLRDKILIDSPGMIDSAEGTVARDYDFSGVVRCFAKFCDLVFFLLDPEKPGTTGETVTVFSKCLTGMEYKLWVVLNKCDVLSSVNDFARVYGTTCWNLARILRTKDLPKIWTVYSGPEKESPSPGMSFLDFNRHRNELLAALRDMSARRADNVFASVRADFERLSLRMRLVNSVMARVRKVTATCCCYAVLASVAVGLSLGWALSTRLSSPWAYGALGFAGGALSLALLHLLCRMVRRSVRLHAADRLDRLYEELYRNRVTIGRHDDLAQRWEEIRVETAETIRKAPLCLPWFAERRRKELDRVIEAFRS